MKSTQEDVRNRSCWYMGTTYDNHPLSSNHMWREGPMATVLPFKIRKANSTITKINAELELPLRDGIPVSNHDATDADDENDIADDANKTDIDEPLRPLATSTRPTAARRDTDSFPSGHPSPTLPHSSASFTAINDTTRQSALQDWPSTLDRTISIQDFTAAHSPDTHNDTHDGFERFSDFIYYPEDETTIEPVVGEQTIGLTDNDEASEPLTEYSTDSGDQQKNQIRLSSRTGSTTQSPDH
ncbi:hypothetical protein BO83DRAFT_428730 [Aspergillus eucalypticola CBS 122712]|uniref:Uncharacterized protein n=1 Tax=Aspergillus eucalypticola (strain CBS 122712 / IBT 29274) TaxID=1448314 RepID=A0A317V8S3_ASPEC|nr:uncharacterized protein BO83DRAFT_428730 [Aspergillus eucalypticola CBS 122712]PWY69397.1 hypothetical protein BO83DRAFT_428730 [Aspergillus eucalypticola CBS 122712]